MPSPFVMTPFLQACGGSGPIRFLIQGEPRSFRSPVLLVGRDPKCDIVLSDSSAEKACVFVLLEGRLFFLPLDSSAVLRNDDVPRAGWIGTEDTFEIGRLSIQPLDLVPVGGHPSFDPLSSEGTRDSDLSFEPLPAFRSRKAPPRLAILPRLMLVGREDPAKFKINYDGVEPAHALILRTSGGSWIADLSLRESTLVNDGPIRAARLRHGDRVTLGSVELIVHAHEDRPVPAPTPTVIVTPPPTDTTVGPILEQVARFQQQTFEQFREMLGSMTEMFGSVMQEHRQFVREELARIDRVTATPSTAPQLTAAPPQTPPPPPPPKAFTPATTHTPIAQPAPGFSAPPPDVGLHVWLQEQLGTLEKAQSSRWQRLVEKIRKK